MINVKDNEWIPSEGYKYLSNGEVWAERIFLGKNDRIENWHDTNEEPPLPPEPPLPDEQNAPASSEVGSVTTGGQTDAD